MFDRSYIVEMNRKAAREAAQAHKEPYVPFDGLEIENLNNFPFPFVGSYRPKGWRLVERLFCDTTGYGADLEPSLTFEQLKTKMLEYLNKPGTYGYTVLECGPFQCYVGVYKKIEKKSNLAKRTEVIKQI